jgi:hypothetical protein
MHRNDFICCYNPGETPFMNLMHDVLQQPDTSANRRLLLKVFNGDYSIANTAGKGNTRLLADLEKLMTEEPAYDYASLHKKASNGVYQHASAPKPLKPAIDSEAFIQSATLSKPRLIPRMEFLRPYMSLESGFQTLVRDLYLRPESDINYQLLEACVAGRFAEIDEDTPFAAERLVELLESAQQIDDGYDSLVEKAKRGEYTHAFRPSHNGQSRSHGFFSAMNYCQRWIKDDSQRNNVAEKRDDEEQNQPEPRYDFLN